MANNENINEYKELHARMKQKIDTTEHWQEVENTFAPLKGEIIIYQDTIEENSETKTISKIKIGAEDDQGNKILLKDLPFIYVEGVTPEQLPVAVFNYDDFPTEWHVADIVDASNAGKAVFLKKDNLLLPLAAIEESVDVEDIYYNPVFVGLDDQKRFWTALVSEISEEIFLNDLGEVQLALTFDNAPTANSNNPVKSNGIKTALDEKISNSEKGVSIATLINGKVPTEQLPSYVDDVLEYSSKNEFPIIGESGKIYISLDDNKTYRWSGSAYVEISQSLAIGETESSAFAGNRGKALEDLIDQQKAASWDAKQDALTFDNTPTRNSNNPVTSTGIANMRITAGQSYLNTLGNRATAEGAGNNASGSHSHCEGYANTAEGSYGHTEGYNNKNTGAYSHIGGANNTATGSYAHCEGGQNVLNAQYSHVEGTHNIANAAFNHIFGKWNKEDIINPGNPGTYIELVGNGKGYVLTTSEPDDWGTNYTNYYTREGNTFTPVTGDTAPTWEANTYYYMDRSNARTLDWKGNEVLAGKLTLGADPTADMDVTTKRYVDGFTAYAYTAQDLSDLQSTAKIIYLANDITTDSVLNINNGVIIDLNGYNLYVTGLVNNGTLIKSEGKLFADVSEINQLSALPTIASVSNFWAAYEVLVTPNTLLDGIRIKTDRLFAHTTNAISNSSKRESIMPNTTALGAFGDFADGTTPTPIIPKEKELDLNNLTLYIRSLVNSLGEGTIRNGYITAYCWTLSDSTENATMANAIAITRANPKVCNRIYFATNSGTTTFTSDYPIPSGVTFGCNSGRVTGTIVYEVANEEDLSLDRINTGNAKPTDLKLVDNFKISSAINVGLKNLDFNGYFISGNIIKTSGTVTYTNGGGIASGVNSVAEGYGINASGNYTHAEGYLTHASGFASHTEGRETRATGSYAHAQGFNTKASSPNQQVFGKYNIEDTNNIYAEIVGNGTADNTRSNARTLDWDGNEVLSGKLTVGADPTDDMDAATKKYVDDAVSKRKENNYELIEKIVIGYSKTTEEPIDWSTNWTNYFINTGTIKKPIYTPVTDITAPTWVADTYYSYNSNSVPATRISADTNGIAYNFKKVLIKCTVISSRSGMFGIGFYPIVGGSNWLRIDMYDGYNTTQQTSLVECEVKNGYYFAHGEILRSTDTYRPMREQDILNFAYDSIKEIRIGTPNDTFNIPAGSTFEIWGVWA